MLALLLIFSTVADIPHDPDLVWTAPPALSMDAGKLPFAESTRQGTFLPAPLDVWTLERLSAYRLYPSLCQLRLDQAFEVCQKQCADAVASEDLDGANTDLALQAQLATSLPSWLVWVVGAVGFVVGGAVVFLAVELAR